MSFAAEILQAIDDLSTDEDLTADDILQDVRDKASAEVDLIVMTSGVRSAIRVLDRNGATVAANAVWNMYDSVMFSAGVDSVTVVEDAPARQVCTVTRVDAMEKWQEFADRTNTSTRKDVHDLLDYLGIHG